MNQQMNTSKTILIGFLLFFVAVVALPVKLTGAVTFDNEKFSAALESQISCEETLEPAKAVGALRRAGIIEREPYLVGDSINYFKAKKPLTVWGLKVVSVYGFDHNPQIFERGPGTAPPITLGVIVPYSKAKVQSELSKLGLQNIKIEAVEDSIFAEELGKQKALTQIYCEKF